MDNYLGIDIGGTNIKYALLNKSGNIVESSKIKTPHKKELFFNKLDKIIKKYQYKIKGIAFCAPGKIIDTTIHLGGSLPFLDGINLGERYQHLNLPIAGINDGKASVLAESWIGNLKNISNCAAITLGTGVGGGIIINGKLVSGQHYQAGELSFMQLNPNKSHFSGYAGDMCSAVKMIKQINKIIGNSNIQDGLAAFKAINSNTKSIMNIFKDYCHNIAILIINIQSVIDLERIAIGGGISSQPIVIKELNQQYQNLLNDNELIATTLTQVKIVPAKFKNDANIYGALYNLLLKINP